MTTPSPDERTTDGLLACPFCGNLPSVIEENNVVCQTRFCPMEFYEIKLTMWNRRTPALSLTASLERVKELEKENLNLNMLLGAQAVEIDDISLELAEEKRLRQELRHIANMGGAEMSNLCDVFIDEKNRYKAECERLQADLEAAEKEKARIKRESHNCYEDCVSKLDANQRIATEQERVMQLVCIPMIEQKEAEFTQSQTHARAEAKALAFEECRQTVAQVFDDYRHLIQREFNEKYGGVDNLSGENFLGDAVDFAIRKIEAEGGSQSDNP